MKNDPIKVNKSEVKKENLYEKENMSLISRREGDIYAPSQIC